MAWGQVEEGAAVPA
ncbi:hypothetical protein HaLaN_31621, partial [Haematococcus lacustris]